MENGFVCTRSCENVKVQRKPGFSVFHRTIGQDLSIATLLRCSFDLITLEWQKFDSEYLKHVMDCYLSSGQVLLGVARVE